MRALVLAIVALYIEKQAHVPSSLVLVPVAHVLGGDTVHDLRKVYHRINTTQISTTTCNCYLISCT